MVYVFHNKKESKEIKFQLPSKVVLVLRAIILSVVAKQTTIINLLIKNR